MKGSDRARSDSPPCLFLSDSLSAKGMSVFYKMTRDRLTDYGQEPLVPDKE